MVKHLIHFVFHICTRTPTPPPPYLYLIKSVQNVRDKNLHCCKIVGSCAVQVVCRRQQKDKYIFKGRSHEKDIFVQVDKIKAVLLYSTCFEASIVLNGLLLWYLGITGSFYRKITYKFWKPLLKHFIKLSFRSWVKFLPWPHLIGCKEKFMEDGFMAKFSPLGFQWGYKEDFLN